MKHTFILILIIILTGCFGSEPQKTGKEGKPMPDFSLLLQDSVTIVHTKDIPNGKASIFFYFSPYCPYCKAQTKSILDDIDRMKDIQIYFITSHPVTALKGFYKENQLSKYPNITTGVDTARFIHDYFEVAGVPYLAIYGKDKKLNRSFMGKTYIRQLIAAAEE